MSKPLLHKYPLLGRTRAYMFEALEEIAGYLDELEVEGVQLCAEDMAGALDILQKRTCRILEDTVTAPHAEKEKLLTVAFFSTFKEMADNFMPESAQGLRARIEGDCPETGPLFDDLEAALEGTRRHTAHAAHIHIAVDTAMLIEQREGYEGRMLSKQTYAEIREIREGIQSIYTKNEQYVLPLVASKNLVEAYREEVRRSVESYNGMLPEDQRQEPASRDTGSLFGVKRPVLKN